jgi:hypothetical protein
LRDDVAISSTLPRHCEERSDVARGILKDEGERARGGEGENDKRIKG